MVNNLSRFNLTMDSTTQNNNWSLEICEQWLRTNDQIMYLKFFDNGSELNLLTIPAYIRDVMIDSSNLNWCLSY